MPILVAKITDSESHKKQLKIVNSEYVYVNNIFYSNSEDDKISRFISAILKLLNPCLDKARLVNQYTDFRHEINSKEVTRVDNLIGWIEDKYNVKILTHENDEVVVDVDDEQCQQRILHFIWFETQVVHALNSNFELSLSISLSDFKKSFSK